MQMQKPSNGDLGFPALSLTRAGLVSSKYRTALIVLWLMAVALLTAAAAEEINNGRPKQESTPGMATEVINSVPAAMQKVRTTAGIVRGVIEGGVSTFKGIPFAAPPVGDYRWRPPQPAPSRSNGSLLVWDLAPK